MLINKINEEFEELLKVIGDNFLFFHAPRLHDNKEDLRNLLLSMSTDIRKISRIEVILENKKFESKMVENFSDECMICIKNFYKQYDKLIEVISKNKKESDLVNKIDGQTSTDDVYEAIIRWKQIFEKARLTNEIISKIIEETWEPLPDDKEEDKVNNIIVSSETRSMSLNNVASDVDNLDRFFNSVCSLVGQDKNQDKNIYLRKVETGSLTVAISCVIGIAPIIKFMFWVIKLCQDTAERSLNIEEKVLNNKEKRLKIINDEIDIAKKIFEIQPDNKAADELIQGCAIHFLDFLENNPTGTINGKHYDTGIEKLKIEDKENK